MPRKPRKSKPERTRNAGKAKRSGNGPIQLRIVGGEFRGRKLQYSGDAGVRPMKDRVREALFNLLGPAVRDTYAIDLFGGTGALALEAISRGATGAHIIECHLPTARVIRQNIQTLGLEDRVTLVTTSAFAWAADNPELPERRWTVFISPPYRYFVEERDTMLELIERLRNRAPEGTLLAVEATDEFDFTLLPDAPNWDVRRYPPAVVGVYVCDAPPAASS